MTAAQINLPPKLVPVFQGETEFRGAWGGRGSAKSKSFALMTAVFGYRFGMSGEKGLILCARQKLNSLEESSLEEVKGMILLRDPETREYLYPWLVDYYEIGEKYIRSKDGNIRYGFAGLTSNLDSVKSKSRILIAWVEEADGVSETAWSKLIPTIREDGSECWLTWNRETKNSATDKRFIQDPPKNSKIVKLNWRDNPWFTTKLNNARLEDLEKRPDTYQHVWEGDYLEYPEGAFWLREINKCYTEGRIGKLPVLESQPCMTFWDIGNSDGTAIWVVQKVGMEFRCINFYESWGEPYNHAVKWLKSLDLIFEDMYLPHDADHTRQGQNSNKSPKQMLKELMPSAKWHIVPRIPEITWGIQQTSDMFPYIYIDDVSCSAGLDHLKSYRRKWSNSEQRWTHVPDKSEGHSEAADALRQMAQAFTSGDLGRKSAMGKRKPIRRNIKGVV